MQHKATGSTCCITAASFHLSLGTPIFHSALNCSSRSFERSVMSSGTQLTKRSKTWALPSPRVPNLKHNCSDKWLAGKPSHYSAQGHQRQRENNSTAQRENNSTFLTAGEAFGSRRAPVQHQAAQGSSSGTKDKGLVTASTEGHGDVSPRAGSQGKQPRQQLRWKTRGAGLGTPQRWLLVRHMVLSRCHHLQKEAWTPTG